MRAAGSVGRASYTVAPQRTVCFGQGVEAVTGCSALHGTMSFEEKPKSMSDWFVVLEANGRGVEIRVKDHVYAGADEVLSLKDEELFASVTNPSVAVKG